MSFLDLYSGVAANFDAQLLKVGIVYGTIYIMYVPTIYTIYIRLMFYLYEEVLQDLDLCQFILILCYPWPSSSPDSPSFVKEDGGMVIKNF
jgi:hypothetical protein